MVALCARDVLGGEARARRGAPGVVAGPPRGGVSRAAELRKETKKARQLKHKALVDLLKHLAQLGLSFHASTDKRQATMADLFQVGGASRLRRGARTAARRRPLRRGRRTDAAAVGVSGRRGRRHRRVARPGGGVGRVVGACGEPYYRCVSR